MTKTCANRVLMKKFDGVKKGKKKISFGLEKNEEQCSDWPLAAVSHCGRDSSKIDWWDTGLAMILLDCSSQFRIIFYPSEPSHLHLSFYLPSKHPLLRNPSSYSPSTSLPPPLPPIQIYAIRDTHTQPLCLSISIFSIITSYIFHLLKTNKVK